MRELRKWRSRDLLIAKRHNGVPTLPRCVVWVALTECWTPAWSHMGCANHPKARRWVTLANLLDQFEAAVAGKPTTQYKHCQVADSLRAFLGAANPQASIAPKTGGSRSPCRSRTPTTRPKPAKPLARDTVAKSTVIAEGVCRKAVRWGYVASNPFAELR